MSFLFRHTFLFFIMFKTILRCQPIFILCSMAYQNIRFRIVSAEIESVVMLKIHLRKILHTSPFLFCTTLKTVDIALIALFCVHT